MPAIDESDIRYDAALAAAFLILELFESSPGAPGHLMLGQVTFVVLEAVYEAERRVGRATRQPSEN
ncbi:MAG: hypothetical protein U0835_00630 [Isosphaeraceae bacterium]